LHSETSPLEAAKNSIEYL